MTGALRWMAVALVALLMAGCSSDTSGPPSVGSNNDTSETQKPTPVPTVLILDASGSMTTPDAPGPRIDAAKSAAKGLVAALPDNAELGLTTYGTGTDSSDAAHDAGCKDVTSLLAVGPLDRNTLNTKIDSLTPSGYTPISLALETAVRQLPGDGSPQAVVLVSDGEDTCGRPPCDVAAQLHRDHPGLSISTVGFRTDGPASEQLACIADTTGGLFVQAANSKQLAARLLATQDVHAAKGTLSSTGFLGIDLGSTASDIRKANNDFPDVAASGRVIVQWKDCDFTFTNGVLDSIAPHDGGRTIDGISSGSKVSEAVEFYGQPLGPVEKDGGHDWLTFPADKARGFAYRMSVDGYSNTGSDPAGTISRIMLCRCMPHDGDRVTIGAVSFLVPDGWQPRQSSGGTLTPPLIELAPSADAQMYIAVWFTDVSQDPKSSLEAVRQSGVGGMSTFGGKQVWTYAVDHTISSGGPEKYLLRWYYIFDGNYRVDVACDALADAASQASLTPICEQFIESLRIEAPKSQPPSGPPVATFDGYGPIKIGMTKDEAIAAMGSPAPVNHYYSCTVVGQNAAGALKVWIYDKTGRVTGIEAPPGAMTDRGVGDGSTPDQIKATYAGPGFYIEAGYVGGQGSEAVNVRNDAGQLISFGIDSGRAESPSIGRARASEGCQG